MKKSCRSCGNHYEASWRRMDPGHEWVCRQCLDMLKEAARTWLDRHRT